MFFFCNKQKLVPLIIKTRLVIKASFLFVASLLVIPITGCERKEPLLEAIYINGPTMGTNYNITLVSPPKSVKQTALKQEIDLLLKALNQEMSTYIVDSDIMLFNQRTIGQPQFVKDDFLDVLILSQRISELTSGYFDITVGPLVELWGFGRNVNQQVPSADEVEKAKSKVGWEYLVINPSAKTIEKQRAIWLDVSAIAKGFAVDKVAGLMETKGIEHFLVEIGGEMRVKGFNRQQQRWRVGIETPSLLQNQAQQLVQFSDKAIATSGDYRNYFEKDGQRFSHTIDPSTGMPVKHNIASVSVVADTAAEADALATALNVLGEVAAIELANKEHLAAYFIFYDDTQGESVNGYRIVYTDSFKEFIQ